MTTTDDCVESENGIYREGPSRKPLIEILPAWVLAGTGVIYATGFLVVLAYLDRYGIREAGADFWKARYIHIGIICLAFPLILNGTLLSGLYLILHGKYSSATMWPRLLPVTLLAANLEVVCFFMLMLTNRAPGGSSIAGLDPIKWIIAITLGGIALALLIERVIDKAVGRVPKGDSDLSPHSQNFSVITRWVLVVIIGCLDVWFFLDFKGTITNAQPAYALTYVGFSIILGVMLTTVAIYEKRQNRQTRKKAIVVLFAAIIGPFFYLVVLSFSYGVYQNIPSTRGGGDYTLAPKVILTMKARVPFSKIDAKYFDPDNPQISIPLVLIEETSWALYLADPNERGGPKEWKLIGGRKPEIFIVNKNEIIKLHSESRNPNKKQGV